jgi:hypothetical protein
MAATATLLPPREATDTTWLRLAQLSIALLIPTLLVFAVVGTFFTTISEGDFRYDADYWYTAVGLPLTAAGIGLVFAVHRLQHGRDGRLGTVGLWINIAALTELFAQLLASVVQGAEVRWGPLYPVCALLSFVGVALLAAGSWRTGLLPKWMLGVWPLIWIVGGLAAKGPTPVLLAAFLVGFGAVLTQRTRSRQSSPEGAIRA